MFLLHFFQWFFTVFLKFFHSSFSLFQRFVPHIHLLLVIWQLDNHKNDSTLLGDCIESANALVTRLQKWSERRGIDQFQAKAYFFQCQAVCAAGISCQTLFNFWHQAIRTAILRSNVHSQACLYNLQRVVRIKYREVLFMLKKQF